MLKEFFKRFKITKKRILIDLTIILLFLITGFFSFSFVKRVENPPIEVKNENKKPIEVQVLNGCGKAGIATETCNYLRYLGYDVVNDGNASDYDFTETIVVDRKGNIKNAEKIAYALGVPYQNVFQQINDFAFLDVTIILGKDYHTLKPFKK